MGQRHSVAIVRIRPRADARFEMSDRQHVRLGEHQVDGQGVLGEAMSPSRLGDYRHLAAELPGQENLGRGGTMRGRNSPDDWVNQEPTPGQR